MDTLVFKDDVMLGSGRGKCRLNTTRDKGVFEGCLQRGKMLGASTAAPDSGRLFEEFQGTRIIKGSAHSEVVQRLREIQVTRKDWVDSS